MRKNAKDFSKVKTASPVYNTIAAATGQQIPGQLTVDLQGNIKEEPTNKKKYKSRKTYTETEAADALETLQTSGKKGVKLPRINMAFTPTNYEFIKTMAQVRGQNLTEFLNDIISEARETHKETYQKAIEFRNSL